MVKVHRFLGLGVLLLMTTRCSYVEQRVLDLADVFRAEISFGLGAQAHVNIGEVTHIGVGSSYRKMFGLHYGVSRYVVQTEDHFPLSYIWSLSDPEHTYLHRILVKEDKKQNHHGYVILPGELNHDEWDKPVIHYLNIEVGGQALLLGVDIGFSIGEFLDFLVGLFKFSDDWEGLDLGNDDLSEQRVRRSLRIKREKFTSE